MTNKEAIKKLKEQQAEFNENYVDFAGVNEAYDLAIKALEERPQGEWIKEPSATFRCSECNNRIPIKYDEINEHMAKITKPRFCDNCGADMRKGGAE